jgi:phospholipid/cholesterol/gamma-HCH transport system permease protein
MHSMPAPKTLALETCGRVGARSLALAGGVGRAALFLGRALAMLLRPPYRVRAVLEQVQFVGNRSLVIVALTSAFTGLVLTLQGYNALSRFGAQRMVGALVALSLVRELAPVRLWASVISVPPLTALFTVCGLFVARAFGVSVLGLDAAGFDASVQNAIEGSDVVEGLVKALIFSVLLAWISTYRGYHASGGAKGVGQATTQAVVETSVLVLALDYVLTALLF